MTTTTSAPALASFAQRVVRGTVTFMAVATVAATIVGFWLSYAGLHAFAHRSGLHGAEAWAWPASVDLFILAGELGITISAIRRQRDPLAWVYLLAGFGPSVAFNILHVVTVAPHWGRYAVAAVPPVAAMLALGALMRQTYRLAVAAHLASAPESVAAPERPRAHHQDAPESNAVPRTKSNAGSTRRAAPRRSPKRAPVTAEDAEREFMGELASGAIPSIRQVRARLHVGDDRAKVLAEHLRQLVPAATTGGGDRAESNGHAPDATASTAEGGEH
jgi:hypothetical protein